ncbi:hypothetical protein K4043_13625 [Stenotrophomonas sp. SRS1]|uniref:hypothetical protein n=1 Tax=Stenotrophomonas sp. SRS1 TaxID=2870345 RepID=UPI0022374F43|nr:hypothetical protein [Stenotrophomonas sp. SRS1]MCW6029049.1 hypothetical protein [Stenotrophomonas sp. SRS1]
MLSKSEVDRIGKSLKENTIDATVLTKLEAYRSEFTPAYSYVDRILTEKLRLNVTGRPAKSTISIIEKLKRIKSRLSQVQDIAGCRVISATIAEQDLVVTNAKQWFEHIEIDDKRDAPMHGYRAIHMLVEQGGKTVEVQVRTQIQHFWASISEKLADKYGQQIKYGKGDERVLAHLVALSAQCAMMDDLKTENVEIHARLQLAKKSAPPQVWRSLKNQKRDVEERIKFGMYKLRSTFRKIDEIDQ